MTIVLLTICVVLLAVVILLLVRWRGLAGELDRAKQGLGRHRLELFQARTELDRLRGELARAGRPAASPPPPPPPPPRTVVQEVRVEVPVSEPEVPAEALHRIAEPQALPDVPDSLPDSVLDGARFGGLVVRSGAVRGEVGRQNAFVRKQTTSLGVLDRLSPPVLVTCVASGRPDPRARGQLGAAQACRSLPDKLAERAAALELAWDRALDGDPGELGELLHGVAVALNGPLNQAARERSLDPSQVATELTFLLSRLGDTGRRSHLVAGIGAGSLLRLAPDGRWLLEFRAGDGGRPATLPGEPGAVPFRLVETGPGDALLLCSATSAEYLARGVAQSTLTAEWSAGPPPLTRFLWQLGLRDQVERKDRALIGLWETR